MNTITNHRELQNLLIHAAPAVCIFSLSEQLAHILSVSLSKENLQCDKKNKHELSVTLALEDIKAFAQSVKSVISFDEMHQTETLIQANGIKLELSLFQAVSVLEAQWLIKLILDKKVTTAFQAILLAGSHEIFAYESLLRMITNQFLVSTGKIFQLAENAGFVQYLDTLSRLSAINNVIEAKLSPSLCFINCSPQTIGNIEKGFVTTNKKIQEAGLAPESLVFEMVKTDLLQDEKRLVRASQYLKKQGYQVALDSLHSVDRYFELMNLTSPDFVKIDARIVNGIKRSKKNQDIVKKIVSASAALGAKTIGLNVETEDEKDVLESLGVDLLQGFYFFQASFLNS